MAHLLSFLFLRDQNLRKLIEKQKDSIKLKNSFNKKYERFERLNLTQLNLDACMHD